MSEFSGFDEIVERRGSSSYKWDWRPAGYPDDVLPMWVADMDFAVAPEILDAVAERLAHPVFGYTFAPDSYLESFVNWQQKRNGWHVDPGWVTDAPGVVPAIRAALLAFSEPGDAVVIQTPAYHVFFRAIRENRQRVLENQLVVSDGVYRMDLSDLRSHFEAGARLMILCSPHNPVGRVWSHDELAGLCEICGEFGVTLISDEIHSDIILGERRFVPFASLSAAPRIKHITAVSPSKTFNVASLSVAQVVIPNPDMRAQFAATVKRVGLAHHAPLSLAATEAAYRHGEQWLESLLPYLCDSAGVIAQRVAERLPGVSLQPIEGTYLAWLDFRGLLSRLSVSERDFNTALIEEGGVWLSRGSEFGAGGEGFFRMNFACPRSTLIEGLDRIERAAEAVS